MTDPITEAREWLAALKADAANVNQALAAIVADGESVADILRHDKGHDEWHASHGDPPCKSDAECQAMQAKYDTEKA